VFDDELRSLPAQVVDGLEVFLNRPARGFRFRAVGIAPGFFVNPFQQVEGVEQEMARSAGRVEDAQIPRVLLRSVLDVYRTLEQLLLGKVGFVILFGGSLFTRTEEDFVRPPHQITASILENRVSLAHLVPDAPQRIVREELHDVARGEELVADRQLPAVPRSLGRIPHGFAFFGRVEILVDPADGLVLGPEVRQFRLVELGEDVFHAALRGEHRRLGRHPVEQNAQVEGEFVEKALQKDPVGVVTPAERAAGNTLEHLKAGGCRPLADAFDDQPAFLAQPQGRQAVEGGEGYLQDHPFVCGLAAVRILPRRAGGVVIEKIAQTAGRRVLIGRQVRQLFKRQHDAVRVQTEDSAELIGDVPGQPTPAGCDGLGQQIPCVLVEAHQRPLIRIRLFDFNSPASFSRMPASHESKSAGVDRTIGCRRSPGSSTSSP